MDNSRPDAFLTDSQRESLTQKEGSAKYNRQHRQRLRSRTIHGIKDLGILFNHMEARDIEQSFKKDQSELKELRELVSQIFDTSSATSEPAILIDELESISERISKTQAELEAIEADESLETGEDAMRIREKKTNLEATLDDLKTQQEEIIRSIISLQKSADEIRQVNTDELPTHIKEATQSLSQSLSRAAEEIDTFEEIAEEDSAQPREPLPNSQLNNIFAEIDDKAHSLSQLIHEELDSPELDPTKREDVIAGLSFFFRLLDTVDVPFEPIIEAAIAQAYSRKSQSKVIGNVSLAVNEGQRDQAAARASRKIGSERLSAVELRAVAETDPAQLEQLSQLQNEDKYTSQEITEAIISEPSLVGQGMNIVDSEPKRPDSSLVPDMVAQTQEGNLLLIDIKSSLDEDQLPIICSRLRDLIQEYGGSGRAHAAVVIPKENISKEHTNLVDEFSDIELKPIDLE